jgi:hypothetical protein
MLLGEMISNGGVVRYELAARFILRLDGLALQCSVFACLSTSPTNPRLPCGGVSGYLNIEGWPVRHNGECVNGDTNYRRHTAERTKGILGRTG